jgi:hypothetical protein
VFLGASRWPPQIVIRYPPMHDLDCFIGQQFVSLERRDYDWVVTFGPEMKLTIECLWRLLENQRIRFASTDEGQRFGLPAPVNAAAEVNQRIAGKQIVSVDLREGTLDLTLGLSTGHAFQILPESSGYEAWQAQFRTAMFVAVGGGNLAMFGTLPRGG